MSVCPLEMGSGGLNYCMMGIRVLFWRAHVLLVLIDIIAAFGFDPAKVLPVGPRGDNSGIHTPQAC